MPVAVCCRFRQTLKVGGKTLFAWAWRGGEVAGPRRKCIPFDDTVRWGDREAEGLATVEAVDRLWPAWVV